MPNKVSFIIELSNRFSKPAKSMSKSLVVIDNRAKKLTKTVKGKVNPALVKLTSKGLKGADKSGKGLSASIMQTSKKAKDLSNTVQSKTTPALVKLDSKGLKGADRSGKGLSRSIMKTDRKARRLSTTIRSRLNPAFQSMRSRLFGVVAAIGASLGLAKLISVGANLQDEFANLSSITGTTGEQLKFLRDETLRLAKSSNIAQSAVARAFTDIASAKSELLKDPKGLSIVTEQALLLANAAGISVPAAVKASVGSLNQFGKGAEDAARFVNILAAGAKVGASQVAQTAEALKNAGTVAAQFGLTFEQTNAILQVFAKSELKGAEAGTSLRGTLIRLEKIAGGAIAPSVIGIVKSLERLKGAGLDNQAIIKEFGEENLRAILILRKNIPLIKQWTGELTGTNIAQEQATVRLSTFNSKVKRLGISIKDSLIKTFERLEPTLTKQVENFTAFLDTIDPQKINNFADSLAGLAQTLIIVGKGFGAVVGGIATVGRFFGKGVAGAVQFVTAGSAPGEEFERVRKIRAQSELNRTAPDLSTVRSTSQTTVDVNIRAPENVVESVQTRTTGQTPELNMGVNMVVAN